MTSTYRYPLIYNAATSTIEQMDSDGLERLSYNLRYAYGQQLQGYNHGSLTIGVNGPYNFGIGSLQDTSANIATNTNTRNNSGGADYPAYPTALDVDQNTTYNYEQVRSDTSTFSTGVALDSDGILFYGLTDSAEATSTPIVSVTDSDNLKGILEHCLEKMYTGDKVGTYRVATTAPNDGGTWVNKGTWFADTTYSAGTDTYNYYLKTDATAPGDIAEPIGLVPGDDNTTLQERLIAHDGDLVQNVLLPALNRRVQRQECLTYFVDTSQSEPGTENRGAFTDTRTTTGTQNQNFGANDPEGQAASNQYWRTLTPDNNAVAQTTKILFLKARNLR